MYDLYIQGDKKVIANENATNMFSNLIYVYTITNLELLDVSNTTNMYYMFSNAG